MNTALTIIGLAMFIFIVVFNFGSQLKFHFMFNFQELLKYLLSGPPGVGARVVRGLHGEVALPEEQPDRGDEDRHSVPLPLLA